MPMLDDLVTFCDETSIATAAGTHARGDVVDLRPEQRDIGRGHPIYFNIIVTEALVGAGASVEIRLVSDAQDPPTGTATVHISTGAIGVADLPKGKRFGIALPIEGSLYERFLGVMVVTSGATTTAGAISAFLHSEAMTDGQKHYPEAAS